VVWTGSHGSEVRCLRPCNGLKRIPGQRVGCKPLAVLPPSFLSICSPSCKIGALGPTRTLIASGERKGLRWFSFLFSSLLGRKSKRPLFTRATAPPDEVILVLDQLYILGVAGGLILQMVATLQANQRSELAADANETARSSYNSIVRQRLSHALRYCDDALSALLRLTRTRTV
jgi:hypothetical protein